MPPKHNKGFLLCIVFFGIARFKAQPQETNFISQDINFGKPVVCNYNGVCQTLYQEDPQRKDHLQRKLRSSGFTRQDLSKMENEWARLKKNNNPFIVTNQDLSEMENEWARLKKDINPQKLQKQDISKMENEWARLKRAGFTGNHNEAGDGFMLFRI
jgi:predicted RNase H-like nuclease (RuvC/YqgF family)